MSRKTMGTYLIRTKLVKMFKQVERNPNKVWIKKDFIGNSRNGLYLDTLVTLGLLERVDVVYNTGKKLKIALQTKGYKLIKNTHSQEKENE